MSDPIWRRPIYALAWWVAIIMGLLGALVHWPINDRPLARLAKEEN